MDPTPPTPPAATGGLHAIAYASTAPRDLEPDELERLMRSARAFNQAHGITGMLLYSGGNFMQVLEGPEPALRQAYVRIKASLLHYDLHELLDEPVQQREFGQWTMGYGRVRPPELEQLLTASGPALRSLMAVFWASNRR